MQQTAIVTVSVLAATMCVSAQAPDPRAVPAESFVVASVKANRSGSTQWDFDTPPGRVVGTNVVLRDLIRFAYYIYGGDWDLRIAGPDWIKTARFDIDGRSSEPVTTPRAMSMLRQLLADRFGLRVRFEQRERPVYSLVLARADGRFGPQFKSSRANCPALEAASQAARAMGTVPTPPGDPSGRPTCGSRGGPGHLSIGGLTMEQIALALTSRMGRQVVDGTGLKGEFDLDLTWAPEPPVGDRDAPSGSVGPSMFTALEEQLGLKVEPARAPIEVLVIDSVEQPTPD